MNILNVTNVFSPLVGGVTRSIEVFRDEFRRRGHRVIVLAPHDKDADGAEEDVIRFPAISKVFYDRFSCDAVVCPSQGIAELLEKNGVERPRHVIPTGIELDRFRQGDGGRIRKRLGIAEDAFVVGYVGRLEVEKNLGFLGRVARQFVEGRNACFLVVGEGSQKEVIATTFRDGAEHQVHFAGTLGGQDLADAYHAMNAFAFASKYETQGLCQLDNSAASAHAGETPADASWRHR